MALSFFGSSDSEANTGSTKGLYFGAPEAEAELSTSSRIYLGDVFQDYLNVIDELRHEKFIISGRKGSGKTAIAEGIRHRASNSPNVFCSLIKNLDLDLETTVQTGQSDEILIRKQIFEWIILTNITSLIMKNEALKEYGDLDQLRRFLNKNRGHIDINEYEMEQIIREQNFDVDITYFKRFFKARFGDKIGISSHKAPFYKLIKYLKRSVVDILVNDYEQIQGNEYLLLFDDLDINFDTSNEEDIRLLLSLLRTAKEYNNDVFGKTVIDAKIFVLVRRDIKKLVMDYTADSSKIFKSYGVDLKWYEHIQYRRNENKVKLKKFINDRIRKCFLSQERELNANDPWSSVVEENSTYENTSGFKYVLDHTFYRPRDLIMFFDPIREYEWDIPLNKNRVDELVVKYSDAVIDEIRNELTLFYNPEEIRSIISALSDLNNVYDIEYSDIQKCLKDNGFSLNMDRCARVLFDYSIIGNIDDNDEVEMKHRERQHERYTLNPDSRFILAYPIGTHFSRRPKA